jgi:hypothetical protein
MSSFLFDIAGEHLTRDGEPRSERREASFELGE